MSSSQALILATQDGIVRISLLPDGSLAAPERPLTKISLEAVTRDSAGRLYAASDEGRIYWSEDGGGVWGETASGPKPGRGLWALAAHPARAGELYAGMEPASLWISRDEGHAWEELQALRKNPAAKKWHFYEPAKPHVRAIGLDAAGDWLYVGIEVGGVLVSTDGGKSFEERNDGVDSDIHTIRVVPADPLVVFAMTGGGLYRSRDAGVRWEKLECGLERWYFVPLSMIGDDGKRLCVGAANEPPPWQSGGADAAIYISRDGGDRWTLARGPFPLDGMVSAIVTDPAEPSRSFAATTDGVLLRSADGGENWEKAAEGLPRIEEMVISRR